MIFRCACKREFCTCSVRWRIAAIASRAWLRSSDAAAILNIDEDPVDAAVARLAARGELVVQEGAADSDAQVYLQELYHAERRVASALQNLLATPSRLQQEEVAGRVMLRAASSISSPRNYLRLRP